MRGSPPIQAALVVVGLLLLLIPLHRLTERQERPSSQVSPPVASKQVRLEVRTTAVPCRFQITFLGKTLWAENASTTELAKNFDIDFPKEGIDLVVDARWETQALAALQVSVSLPDGWTMDRTLWGRGTASDVVTFRQD
ncbi:MAG: hypothetical protein JO232_02455 [Verrucomicrobia bacterium]|nr:hypothetical protein [Verrucomicrobiota bacterium]